MSYFLCIDTATPVCSVVLTQNKKVLSVKQSTDEKSHASYLGVFIKQVLNETAMSVNKIDAIAVSKGPGSYTGLRIGVSTAKGLCYGAGIPLISVETLQAMAYGMCLNAADSFTNDFIADTTLYCPMIDARRMEVYTAVYNYKNQLVKETTAMIVQENSFRSLLHKTRIIFAGNGAKKCEPLLKHKNALFMDKFSHSASNMVDIVQKAYSKRQFEDLAYFEPYYLKDFIATSPKQKII
ncbi:MAG: tRNA (adenosine(37)-N6)-threonylcarbamoyltransferase complex dimerization subunit type 1 TsaB [Bacteroidales bacterium]|nr:tRNA (adenosine(37)-N6)-threonylcarbamoyltransferase complex dimerization subunit type 1 TsaB [Bacteroidales bacterium]